MLKRMSGKVFHFIHLNQSAISDNTDTITDLRYFRQNMSGIEDGRTMLFFLFQKLLKLLLHDWIQTAGRLIKYQQLRVMHQSKDNAYLFPVAKRKIFNLL